MQINYANNETDLTTLTVSGSVGIEDIQELKQAIELRLNNTIGLRLIATDLEYFDMSLLQLFAITSIEARRMGNKIEIHFDVDEDTRRLIAQTGLDEDFLISLANKTI